MLNSKIEMKMFKKTILSSVIAVGLLIGATGCSDFGDTNLDPEHLTQENMDYTYMFTNVQLYMYGTEYEVWRNAMIYISSMIQHTASLSWNGDKYTYSSDYNSAYWDRIYPNGIRDVVEVLNAWKENDEYYAEYQMARIMRAFLFHRMTDMYGDIPYFEAGLGYIENLGYPTYDEQRTIYLDMLQELKEAAEALNGESSRIGNQDLIYGGDVESWRRFAYSLMLRLGMRLSKVEAETAREWVNTAVNGGLFTSNDESAIVYHEGAVETNDTAEPYGKVLSHEDPNAWRLSQTFVDHLKETNDPRLSFIGTVVEDPSKKYSSGEWSYGDTTFVNQLGMPNGYDTNEEATDITNAPNWPGNRNLYSVVNRYTFSRPDAPTFLLTHAENQLLLAEAVTRGWISGNAEDYYNEGVRAAMRQFSQFGITGISEERIQQYLEENPFDATNALEQINVQYWVVTFCDEYEAFANWRRSGYPVLTPVVYIGNVTNGTIPRRFTYRTEEASINTENYSAAVARLNNGDTMTSRVWWDAE